MNKKRNMLICCLLLLIGLSIPAFGQGDANKVLVPDFALLTKDSEIVRLSDYRGKVVVLNFWASWCPVCLSEMGEMQDLHDQLSQRDDAVLLLLNQIDGRRETIKSGTEYLEKNMFTMTNLFDHGLVGGQIFGIPGLPTAVVIDPEGYLASYVVGATTRTTLLRMIEEAK